MALLITKKSFIGEFHFQFQNDTQYWDDFLEQEEELVLIGLFGEVLFNKLKNNPQDTDFDVIKSPFFVNNFECRGLSYIVTAFVYCKLIEHDGVYSGKSNHKIVGETSIPINLQANFSRAWNNGIYNAIALRHKLRDNLAGLEDYNFVKCYKYSNRLW